MTDQSWLFLFTPVPYLAAMYFVAYRYDIARLAKPFHDFTSEREWWSVCRRLGLVGVEVGPSKGPFVGGTRNILLLVSSLVIYAVPFLFQLPWYLLCAVQAAVAVSLFIIVVVNWAGPFPFKPYRDVLPYPRLGSRVRHLGHGEGRKHSPSRESGTPSTPAGKTSEEATP